jgi:CelD/BcsL family acetyltransferase involved in cellulose biosynthesis
MLDAPWRLVGGGRTLQQQARQTLPTGTGGATADHRLVVARDDGFDFSGADYARLHAASGATAFQHPLWLDAFYRRLAGPRGAEKIVVTGRDADGTLRLVLPLIRRRMSGVALLESCDLGVSDYAAPVVDADFDHGPGLAEAVGAVLPAHDILRLRPVRAEHVETWQTLLGGQAVRLDFSAHATTLGASYSAWRQSAYADGFRRMFERKKKRFLKQDGARVRLLTDPTEIDAAIAAIARLRAGRFEGDLIQQDFVAAFYADVARMGAAGLARTYAIELEGAPIGHAFGIVHAGRFNYLLIGCDYEAHGRHSPGLVLYDAMIEDWIGAGGAIFDFTIGDEPFKADFGTGPTPMFEISARPTWRGRLAAAGFAAREQLRRLRRDQKGS